MTYLLIETTALGMEAVPTVTAHHTQNVQGVVVADAVHLDQLLLLLLLHKL